MTKEEMIEVFSKLLEAFSTLYTLSQREQAEIFNHVSNHYLSMLSPNDSKREFFLLVKEKTSEALLSDDIDKWIEAQQAIMTAVKY